MTEKFSQNTDDGDGAGIERSTDNGKTWERVGYINTGAGGSTARLARNVVVALNHLSKLMGGHCPATLGLEQHGDCSAKAFSGECERCWEEALDNA
jgi:hypothetical protein